MQQHFAPTLAFGTYQLSGTECYRAVLNALRAGFRHIDTASIYKNEAEVGAAIRESGISRQELVITTKLAPQQQLGHESAIEALQNSLTRLGLEYVDCYLMHWPATAKKKPQSPQNITYRCDSWKGMCEAKALGLTRHIGVCNFQLRHFESLEDARLPRPDIHQLELHPLCRQRAIVEYCRSRGIILEAYSPLGSGDARLLDDPALIRGLQAATAPGMAAAVDKQVQHRSRACSPSTDFAPSLGQSFNNGESTPPSTIGTAPGGITTASSSAPSVSSSPREAAARALILWSLSQGFRPIVRSTNPVHMSQNLDTLRDFVYCAEAASALMRFDDPSDSSSSGNPLMTSATTHGPPSELRSMSSAAGSDVGGHQQRAVTSLVSIADLLGRANDGSVGPDTHMCWFADKVV